MPKHHRTASKNLQTFRFICRYQPINPFFTNVDCELSFKVQESWQEFKFLQNITSVTNFTICYIFEEYLDIRLRILQEGKQIDETVFNIVNLIANVHHDLELGTGNFFIDIEEVRDNNSALCLQMTGKISGGFFLWRHRYTLNMFRQSQSGEYLHIYESESLPSGKCRWKKFTLPYNILGEGAIKIVINNQYDQEVAFSMMTIDEILTPGRRFDLICDKGRRGSLKIAWSELQLKQNFIDYLRGGLKIRLIIAVDYTSSNFPCHLPTSNHYVTEGKLNNYEQSIQNVVKIMDVYNKDKVIHLFGFGGIPLGQSKTSHCFSLGQEKDVKGILRLYRETLPGITMSKPTILNEIIAQAQKICEEDPDPNNYYVTLILTDGDIHDFPQTTTNIVHSCKYPLSFIIIGIGKADFTSMIKLDSDGAQLKDRDGRIADRDIVQFVEYDLYKYHPGLLASKVLEEIPEQICSYMNQKQNHIC